MTTELVDLIPLGAGVVLELDCGSGALGAAYKRRNPMARVFGVTADPAAAKIASTQLDGVVVADLDRQPVRFADEFPPGGIDCIIYHDALEHLHDPWAVVRRLVDRLSENGVVLFQLPNAEHWQFTERLLRGTLDSAAAPLMHASPHRFSAAAAQRAMLRSGLTPIDVISDATSNPGDVEAVEAFVEAMSLSLDALGIDKASYLRRAAPSRLILRASRRAVGTPMQIVSTMLSPIGGVSHVRVREPMHALAADPALRTAVIGPTDAPPTGVAGPRIFVFHRPALTGEDGLQRLRKLISEGWLVVCEFDDHPDYIPVLKRPDVFNFNAVHAVQTSTEPLADVLRRQNPEVVVFPNALPSLPDIRNYATRDHVSLFFGGLNRENDWPPYLPALNSVAAWAGERLHFRIVNDRRLYDALDTRNKTFTPLCNYETYQELLASCEISFMPLLDTTFNRCKSDLKFIEAAAHRVTTLASSTVYGASVEDGRTGVLFRDSAELEQRLTRLVANPEFGRSLADAARDYVTRNRMLAYQTASRAAWYHSLWERRDELTRALLARVPELLGGASAESPSAG